MRLLDLHDGDPVGRELRAARAQALRAGLASFAEDESPVADAVRQELSTHLASERTTATTSGDTRALHTRLHRDALQAARQAVLAMRASDEIGDDAFHEIEEELDWLEMAGGGRS
jgi:CPA1 family monovalent cation:H+ antiporter